MNRYTIKDSHGEWHKLDADALNIIDGCLSFSKKGAPGLIAQFRDWHSYKVQPIDEAESPPLPSVGDPARSAAIDIAVAGQIAKRQYNKKA